MNNLIYYLYQDKIKLDDGKSYIFVIENQKRYFELIEYLHLGFPTRLQYFTLMNGSSELDIDDVSEFIPDPFTLDINSKKNVSALYKILKNLYYEKFEVDISKLKKESMDIVKNIAMDFDIELSLNGDIKTDDLFKMMDIKFYDEDEELIPRFIRYCKTIHELRKIKFIFTMNIHQYFDNNQINNIISELSYAGMTLIDIESCKNFETSPSEKLFVLDNDLCLLV